MSGLADARLRRDQDATLIRRRAKLNHGGGPDRALYWEHLSLAEQQQYLTIAAQELWAENALNYHPEGASA